MGVWRNSQGDKRRCYKCPKTQKSNHRGAADRRVTGLGVGPDWRCCWIEGQVQGGGGPIASSTVTLWSASANAPSQLAQADADGRFEVSVEQSLSEDVILYLIAKGGEPAVNKAGGDNPAIALMTVVGSKPPAKVVINEMTTVASVWTHAQFLDGAAIRGHALGLRIAAGNVPNFVDLETGGWGGAIQDPLNSARHRRWPTSRRWPTCSPGASRG